ncbi:FHA domain-containing protein [Undibacterium parvum]|uniref:FHA domain-containing protein n=1 Tax=Undibacterium parvum TaxID=401471 RepID=A0A3Q9BNQ2_9BURK|nr:FHA domain-containing protein [Undibacterium parvum]AZP10996.1 FHA domain-containing protein [Undibacterium parvum]
MAKIIVTLNGQVKYDVSLLKARFSIGRRPENDLVLDQATVSGHHAAIDRTSVGIFILDLGSTNGTLVNGQPITKHLLQHEDVIEVGKYRLKFQHGHNNSHEASAVLSTAALSVGDGSQLPKLVAKVKVLSGTNAGRELLLDKAVTSLGRAGVLVVTISKQHQHYVAAKLEGGAARINDRLLEAEPVLLRDGDELDLAGTRMKFSVATEK